MEEQDYRIALKKSLEEAKTHFSKQYKCVTDELEYLSGEQWKHSSIERDSERPRITNNLCRTYHNRIVNPLRKSPMGVNVSTERPEMTDLLRGLIRTIEQKSRASEAYELAYEHATAAGIGFIHVGRDYLDSESLFQEPTIDAIPNPTMAYIDPFSKMIDGSDAKWGILIAHLDSKSAVDTHGDEVKQEIGGLNIYEDWNLPEDSVADILYYNIVEKARKKYWYADGTTGYDEVKWPEDMTEEEALTSEYEATMAGAPIPPVLPLEVIGSRTVVEKKLECTRFIGQKMIDEPVILDIPFIPIVPVYGDRSYQQDRTWSGIIKLLKGSQDLINLYSSNELEMVSVAPISPWIITAGQAKGFESLWKSANRKAWDALIYNDVSVNGHSAPPPQRTDNRAQTEGLIASKQQSVQDLAREVGIFDPSLGADPTAGAESGKAVLLRQVTGDIATAQYLDNLSKSIEQVGRIILAMAPVLYDTNRSLEITEEDGTKVTVQANLKQLMEQLKRIDVEVDAGPAYETDRREALNSVFALGQMVPQKIEAMFDLIVDDLKLPGGDRYSKRLKALLPPELQEGEEGEDQLSPEEQQMMQQTQQAMQEQDATIAKQQEIINFLQTTLQDNEKDRDTDIIEAQIKAEADLTKARIQAETNIYIAELKAQSAESTTIAKERAATERQLDKIEADATQKIMELRNQKPDSPKQISVTEINTTSIGEPGQTPRGMDVPPGGIQADI